MEGEGTVIVWWIAAMGAQGDFPPRPIRRETQIRPDTAEICLSGEADAGALCAARAGLKT